MKHTSFLLWAVSLFAQSAAENESFPLDCNSGEPCGGGNGNGTCVKSARPNEKDKCVCPESYAAQGNRCSPRIFASSDARLCPAYGGTSVGGDEKGGECICEKGHFHDRHCVPTSFRDFTCEVPGDSCSEGKGVCSFTRHTCLCNSPYFAFGNRQCVKSSFKLAEMCSHHSACGAGHGSCSLDITCVCEIDYAAVDDKCVRVDFNPPGGCRQAGDCGFGHGKCTGMFGKCLCDEGYFQHGDMCAKDSYHPRTGCEEGKPCGNGAGICQTGGVCRCKGEYFAKDDACVRVGFADSNDCLANHTACGNGFGTCQEFSRLCVCRNESWAEPGGTTCVSKGFQNPNCITGYACSQGRGECASNTWCQCKEGYHVVPSAERRYSATDCIVHFTSSALRIGRTSSSSSSRTRTDLRLGFLTLMVAIFF
ncbi:hypothetical protein BaRGS_00038854 [Batillaria attramentaria]|uniref:EGF-like domain-containing protein n=1 Tax=Batillaria attramentaria TaxID=370345 RepID=A0ABD0J4K1_9CAEN